MSSTTDIEVRYRARSYRPLAALLIGGKGVFVRNEIGNPVALIDWAIARIQQPLGEMKPCRLAS